MGTAHENTTRTRGVGWRHLSGSSGISSLSSSNCSSLIMPFCHITVHHGDCGTVQCDAGSSENVVETKACCACGGCTR